MLLLENVAVVVGAVLVFAVVVGVGDQQNLLDVDFEHLRGVHQEVCVLLDQRGWRLTQVAGEVEARLLLHEVLTRRVTTLAVLRSKGLAGHLTVVVAVRMLLLLQQRRLDPLQKL